MHFRYKRIFFLLLIPLGYGLMQITSLSPDWVEKWYSQGIYPVLAQGISNVTGLFPFSVAQVILYALVIAAVAAVGYGVSVFFKNIRRYKDYLLGSLANLATAVSVIYFVFVLLCGLNYNRQDFGYFTPLQVQPRQVVDLVETTQYLMKEASDYREEAGTDSVAPFTMPYTFEEASQIAANGLDQLSLTYPVLRGMYPCAKGITFSAGILSELNLCGFIFPFTYEANVNTQIPPSELAFTLCHELAHVRGFMKEGDANFISYLACISTEDPYFQYAGTLHSLIHCMNALYRADSQLYSQVLQDMDPRISVDLRAINGYWAPYDSAASQLSTKVNDTYLKANNQMAGVDSYGDTVDYLIAYYRYMEQQWD